MLEKHEFIRRVEDLAADDAFEEVLERLESNAVDKWKIDRTPEEREKTHAIVMAFDAIRIEIASIARDKDFTAYNTRRTLRSVKN